MAEYFDGRYFSRYEEEIICTGPADKITALKESLSETDKRIIIRSIGFPGNYPAIQIDLSNAWDLLESLVKDDRFKVPQIEMFSNRGTDKYGGGEIACSLFGSEEIKEYSYYEHSSSSAIDKTFIDPKLFPVINDEYTNKLVITLKDGQTLDFSPRKNPVNALEGMKKYSPVLKTIAENCFGYGCGKKDAFVKKTMKQIKDVSNIRSIECTAIEKTREFSLELTAVPDASLCNFVRSYSQNTETAVYDFPANKVTEIRKESLFLPDMNNRGTMTETVLRETVSEENVSLSNEDAQFVFGKKLRKASCDKCLYNAQVIEVPEKTDRGEEIIAIGNNCFDKCTSVKKILLPKSVTWFGENAFTKCKKLETIARTDSPDENAEIINTNAKGDTLRSMCSLTDEYIVPNEIHEIGAGAFGGCPKLETLVLHSKAGLCEGSLTGCRTLKTVKVPRMVYWSTPSYILGSALKTAGIKKVVIGDEEINMTAEYMYDCLKISDDTLWFNFQNAVKEIRNAKAKTIETAIYLMTNHYNDIKDCASQLMDTAVQYAIGSGDTEGLSKLLETEADYKLDYSKLIDMAKRLNQTECSLILLNKSGTSESEKVQTIVTEKEIQTTVENKLYIKVRFEDNKAYSYLCRYAVRPGDRVYVGGKKAGQPGEVVEILPGSPSGRAAMYTLEVEKAYRLSVETISDSQDFGDLLGDL